LEGPHWVVYDTPDAAQSRSKWRLEDGVLTEVSNFYKSTGNSRKPETEREGTHFIYQPGKDFTDGQLAVEIASSDNDALGVAFRYQAPNKYYLWYMDKQDGYRVLACKDGDNYRVLDTNDEGYDMDRWYCLQVKLDGPVMTVLLDGKKDLEATDDTHPMGTFALYAWGCAGAKFRNLRWLEKQEEKK
jgi:hypothetical protein